MTAGPASCAPRSCRSGASSTARFQGRTAAELAEDRGFPATANLIREGKSAGLRNTMETGVKEGMCLMDNVVFGLWQEKRIAPEVAQANISNRVLKQKIS